MKRLALAALTAALVLVGCSDDESPEPRISPTDTSSAASTPTTPAPTTSGPVEPTMPAAAEGDDAAAAEAFVRHYWAMVNYAQATGDVEGLRSLAIKSCGPCSSGTSWIERIYRAGGHIEGGEYTVGRVQATAVGAGDLRLFEVETALVTTNQTIVGAGPLNESFPGEPGKAVVTLVVSKGHLKVSDWGPA